MHSSTDESSIPSNIPIVFGVLIEDPAALWPSRNLLLTALSAERDVIYLQRDRRRLPRLPSVRHMRGREFVMTGAFRLTSSPRARRFMPIASRIDGWLFTLGMMRARRGRYCFWLATPEPWMLDHQRPALTVFDLVDPCLTPGLEADHDRRTRLAAARADVIFTTAAALERSLKRHGVPSVRLPNAARREDVTSPLTAVEARTTLGLPRGNVVGYLGTIDSRVDLKLLAETAALLPDWTFVFAGRVNAEQEVEAAPLRARPNVRLLGSVDEHVGQAVVAASDVCVIPFLEDEVGDAINPVKMFTYLSFGKPVVSTTIEECVANPFVLTASGAQDFAAMIERSVSSATDERNGRQDYAASNTWEDRASVASAALAGGWLSRDVYAPQH